ncbi:MAG: class I SAM-dependent methyltransferase [Chromatiaceae bacterium]|jgi:SAM-dependent methyltransferase
MWDQRYDTADYVYGKEPNDFLRAMADRLPSGRALCLGEGEGRNAVFLAGRGFEVTAVDGSGVGLAKTERLADERQVTVATVRADLADFPIEPASWNLIVSIFCHVPAGLRADLHRRVVEGLRPGGMFLLEAYNPGQIEYGTGGPPTPDLMMDLAALKQELAGLRLIHALEAVRDVREGRFHSGPGAVVQILAVKD